MSMLPTVTPKPTCIGLVPPRDAVSMSDGEPAPRRVWLKTSWNVTREDLKPGVFTLATLLPITSILVWWVRRPDTALKSERIMVLH